MTMDKENGKVTEEFLKICDNAGVVVGSTTFSILHSYWSSKDEEISRLRSEVERLNPTCNEDPAISGNCRKTLLQHKEDEIADLQRKLDIAIQCLERVKNQHFGAGYTFAEDAQQTLEEIKR